MDPRPKTDAEAQARWTEKLLENEKLAAALKKIDDDMKKEPLYEDRHAYLKIARILETNNIWPSELGDALPFFLAYRCRGTKLLLKQTLKALEKRTLWIKDQFDKQATAGDIVG